MSKEELEKIKQELREEIRKELNEAIESTKKYSVWTNYQKEYIVPKLFELGYQEHTKSFNRLKETLGTLARIYVNKSFVSKITEEDLEKIKSLIEMILERWGNRNENN